MNSFVTFSHRQCRWNAQRNWNVNRFYFQNEKISFSFVIFEINWKEVQLLFSLFHFFPNLCVIQNTLTLFSISIFSIFSLFCPVEQLNKRNKIYFPYFRPQSFSVYLFLMSSHTASHLFYLEMTWAYRWTNYLPRVSTHCKYIIDTKIFHMSSVG